MSISVVRFEHANAVRWGVLFARRIAPLSTDHASTGELLRHALPGCNPAAQDAALPLGRCGCCRR
jgi:hypothetical protein